MTDNNILKDVSVEDQLKELEEDIRELQDVLDGLNNKYNEKKIQLWSDPSDRDKAFRIIDNLKQKRVTRRVLLQKSNEI